MIKIVPLTLSCLLLAGCFPSEEVNVTNYPDAETPGARAYIENCSDCHMPPQPARYSAREWGVIVTRMQQRRIEKRMPMIGDDALRLIMEYLRLHAREIT